mmetsp:Transcript_53389/g.153143  ORF Transcript_53389/g.153143 Transcript_53389/m.153143 type:complete len:104 (-) Transcript_53389:155-466(-)
MAAVRSRISSRELLVVASLLAALLSGPATAAAADEASSSSAGLKISGRLAYYDSKDDSLHDALLDSLAQEDEEMQALSEEVSLRFKLGGGAKYVKQGKRVTGV